MIAAETKFTDTSKKVLAAKDKGAYRSFGHAAASIRKDAVASVLRRKNKRRSSPPGTPPYTHSGLARKAIFFDATKEEAVIGFRKSIIGMVAATHEHGLTEDGRQYPERPTMAPALERNIERFHKEWRSSIS
jgi:hypothetical protein